jgi:hypothetical protein
MRLIKIDNWTFGQFNKPTLLKKLVLADDHLWDAVQDRIRPPIYANATFMLQLCAKKKFQVTQKFGLNRC